jgi:hypothetical protein
MIDVVVVMLTLGAVGVATVTWFRQRLLREALRDASRRLYLAQAQLNELESTVRKDLQALRGEIQQRSGGSLIEPSMTIAAAIAIDPRIRDTLAQFHLGGCCSCAIDEEATLAQAAVSHGVNLERLMDALNALGPRQQLTLQETRHSGLLQLVQF